MDGILEVRAGIEPTFADLQSAASPLCHRTIGQAQGGKTVKSAGLRPLVSI